MDLFCFATFSRRRDQADQIFPRPKQGQQFQARALPPRVNPPLHACFALNVSVTQMQSPHGNFAPSPRQANNAGRQTHESDFDCAHAAILSLLPTLQWAVRAITRELYAWPSRVNRSKNLEIQRSSLTLFAQRWRLSVVATRLNRKRCLISFAARPRRTQVAR